MTLVGSSRPMPGASSCRAIWKAGGGAGGRAGEHRGGTAAPDNRRRPHQGDRERPAVAGRCLRCDRAGAGQRSDGRRVADGGRPRRRRGDGGSGLPRRSAAVAGQAPRPAGPAEPDQQREARDEAERRSSPSAEPAGRGDGRAGREHHRGRQRRRDPGREPDPDLRARVHHPRRRARLRSAQLGAGGQGDGRCVDRAQRWRRYRCGLHPGGAAREPRRSRHEHASEPSHPADRRHAFHP